MASDGMERPKCSVCLLLVFGIPGSGKTTFVRSLSTEMKEPARLSWIPLAVHFDDFYPPDLRAEQKETKDFVLKDARQRVKRCIEYFITRNLVSGSDHSTSETSQQACSVDHRLSMDSDQPLPQQEWKVFTNSVKTQLGDKELTNGRLSEECSKSIVFLLDDNMPLRSMRYEYYQLARKYGLCFAQACLQCLMKVAKERNESRLHPVPDSTIENLERSMEYPEPDQNHWEELSLCINSEVDISTLKHERVKVLSLVEEALRRPVPPLPEVDTILKESCQAANIDNYVHQADRMLRKLVSLQLESPLAGGKEEKAKVARAANQARKTLLDEIRHGEVCGTSIDPTSVGLAHDDRFRVLVETSFTKLLSVSM